MSPGPAINFIGSRIAETMNFFTHASQSMAKISPSCLTRDQLANFFFIFKFLRVCTENSKNAEISDFHIIFHTTEKMISMFVRYFAHGGRFPSGSCRWLEAMCLILGVRRDVASLQCASRQPVVMTCVPRRKTRCYRPSRRPSDVVCLAVCLDVWWRHLSSSAISLVACREFVTSMSTWQCIARL